VKARAGRFLRLAAAAVLGTALVAGCGAFDEQQRRWVFQPGQRTWASGAAAADGLEDVWITFESPSEGTPVRLHALWLPQPDPQAPRLLYLHGAKWDVRSSAARIRRMQALGFAVLAVDYRGFGESTAGLPSETSAVEDARAAWAWLGERSPGVPRYVFGHSLGGAIAVQLAAGRDDVAGLLLEGTFTSIPDVFRTMQWGWLPLGPFITQRFDSLERIGQVQAPVLVVHGSDDRLIRPELGRALYERAPEPKRFVLVDGGSHHNTNAVGQAAYRDAVGELFGVR
jgi:alpha-beta hydrolase superfamily lysophospholipase